MGRVDCISILKKCFKRFNVVIPHRTMAALDGAVALVGGREDERNIRSSSDELIRAAHLECLTLPQDGLLRSDMEDIDLAFV